MLCWTEEVKKGKGESTLLVSQPKLSPNFNHDPKKDRSKFKPNHYAPKRTQVFKRYEYGQARKVGGYDVVQKSKVKCFFCHKDGHKKSECRKFSSWLEKQHKQEGVHKQKETKWAWGQAKSWEWCRSRC